MNGGPIWKRCFIWIEKELIKPQIATEIIMLFNYFILFVVVSVEFLPVLAQISPAPVRISPEQLFPGFAYIVHQFFEVGGFIANGFRFVLVSFVTLAVARSAIISTAEVSKASD